MLLIILLKVRIYILQHYSLLIQSLVGILYIL
nr:MAG TPA: hypothetical protein [Crassvirales sp.]